MKNDIFSNVEVGRIKGSKFNLSHKVKTTFDIGELCPTLVLECLPGDVHEINVEHMVRFAPMITPIFHNLKVDTHLFFVPYRILWSQFEDWITGETEVDPPQVVLTSAGMTATDIGTHLGYRVQNNQKQLAYNLAAYALIYDEYYRQQFVQTTEKYIALASGNANATTKATIAEQELYRRAWQHDYFSSCLPTPQRSDAVELPVLTQEQIPVTMTWAGTAQASALLGDQQLRLNSTGALATSKDVQSDAGGILNDGTNDVFIDPNGTMEVDFQGLIPNINDLREALAFQRWLEKEMRTGTRYTEQLLSFWGVRSLDARLQRPEYIGGASGPVVISEVLTTAETTGNPVGNMQGHGISVNSGTKFKYKVHEHGVILGITSIVPESGYYQGIHRSLTRETRYDYGNPMFAMLGEQAVLQKEIYAAQTDTQTTLDTVFGYMPIFSEYKYMNNVVNGEFRTTLEYWHMDRKFTSAPVLNSAFIECNPDGGVFASITGNSEVYAMIANNIYSYRKLPKFGIPSIVG